MTESADDDLIANARRQAEATGVESATAGPAWESAGDSIGRYRLLEEIGEGGMGTVWMAQQSEPVERRVALKVIKLGMDTREVVVRFEAERQALALMDHAHIAKVLDGGATAQGRPYFVMELVQGVPITEYCDRHRVALRGRLELFGKVCGAIQHAHLKGVIHRDIKPSNVLVTEQDGVPTPKVIDFGIAKATSAELTQKTLFTRHAQLVGTPEYMAPEQAGMGGLDIDTRADVYSLGVLLYELLTGTKPFDIGRALEVGYEELLRTIREVDPAKPSTRVSTLGEAATSIATRRHANAEGLSRNLRGDLDWIVMKALEKDRRRRYETAEGFAADIGRFLRDEPVIAAPPGAAYRLRKFIRRRRKTVAAVATITVVLIAGSIGTAVGWIREAEQRQRAETNEARALDAEADAESIAEFQSGQLGAVNAARMGQGIHDAILAALPQQQLVAIATALEEVNFTDIALGAIDTEILDRASVAIDAQFEDRPHLRTRLLQTVAYTLWDLGLVDAAIEEQRRTLAICEERFGTNGRSTLQARSALGGLLQTRQGMDAAEAEHRRAIQGLRALGEQDEPLLFDALHLFAFGLIDEWRLDDARPLLREALDGRLRVFGEDDLLTVDCLQNQAWLLARSGEMREAEALYRDVLDTRRRLLGPDDARVLGTMTHLAAVFRETGRIREAEELYREVLERRRRVLGEAHYDTVIAYDNLGMILIDGGKHDEAERYVNAALAISQRVLGDEHAYTRASSSRLADLSRARGDWETLEAHQREQLERRRAKLGGDHLSTAYALVDLARTLGSADRHQEAEPLCREAVAIFERRTPADSLATLSANWLLGSVLTRTSKPTESVAVLRKALEGYRRALGPNSSSSIDLQATLGGSLRNAGRNDEAVLLLTDALERAQPLGAEVPVVWTIKSQLAFALAEIGELDDAERLCREVLEAARGRADLQASSVQHARGCLAGVLMSRGDFAAAAIALRESLQYLRRDFAPQLASTADTLGNLAFCLKALGRTDEAEDVLRDLLRARRELHGDASRSTMTTIFDLTNLLDDRVSIRRFDGLEEGLAEAAAALADFTGEMLPVMQDVVATVRAAEPIERATLGRALALHGRVAVAAGRYEVAESALREATPHLTAALGPDDWRLRYLDGFLGVALAGQGRWAEAEPILVDAARWMRDSGNMPGSLNPMTDETVRRVVLFYEDWHRADPGAGHDADALDWRR